MTNFEKWKEELTVDKFVKIAVSYPCYSCIAKSHCKSLRKSKTQKSCDEIIRDWANKESGQ